MIEAGEWIQSREPAPPVVLAERLAAAVGDRRCADNAGLSELLLDEAAKLLGNLHDDRKSAEDLLAADALITYAMEGAADDPDLMEQVTTRAIAKLAEVSSCGGKA